MKKLSILLILLGILPTYSQANEWVGTVVAILDGDTVKVLNQEKEQVKIRLTEIDAPESSQAFGTKSKQSLSKICFNKSVVVMDGGTDRYKRTLGRLICDGVDANAEQVKRGMAWAYRKYLTDNSIISLEDTAKINKIGLWVDENPTPPWEFRKNKKKIEVKPKTKKAEPSNGFTCGGKSRCGDMSSCAEAKFYLTQCGKRQLDRDRDGIPCESICK